MKTIPVHLRIYTVIWIICFYTLSSSCDIQDNAESILSTPSADVLTFVATDISTVSSTESATLEPTSTITIVKTPIILSETERQDLILKLLDENGGCEMPCLWGITPGISTWNETKDLLEEKGLLVGAPIKANDLNIYGIVGGLTIEGVKIHDGFGEMNGLVETISIQASGNPDEKFQQAFKNYSLKSIVTKLGAPSRVWLEGHEGDRFAYRLWVFYDEQGILLRYSGTTQVGGKYHICPSVEDGDITTVEILVKGLQYQPSLEVISGYEDYQKEFIHSLNDLGISPIEFYELFSGKSVNKCLDIW